MQKITSFSAHSSGVLDLKIGRSGRVLVTAGEDKKVNLFAIGKPASILSLGGHTSSVTSVSMDWQEQLVVAGTLQGVLKLWDLEQAKVIKTLPGHKSRITSLEFHPFGEFFASGSADVEVKLWDLRMKGCLQTYHGHTAQINDMKITPDGRWIASGSEDGTVKIWDMTAGRIINTIEFVSPVVSIAFNPSEFVIASASFNQLMVHDLQSFECISSYTIPEHSQPDIIVFGPSGDDLLSISAEKVTIISWDPVAKVTDSIAVPWRNVKDIRTIPGTDKLVGATANGSFVDVWGIKLPKVSQKYPLSQDNTQTDEMAIEFQQDLNIITSTSDLPEKSAKIRKSISKSKLDQSFSAKHFDYIPSCDGNTLLNLDLSKFMGSRQVIT